MENQYDDEFRQEDEYDAQCIEYIKNYLPSDLKDTFTEEELYLIYDVMVDYFVSSGLLDSDSDKDGVVEIDIDAVVDYVIKKIKKQGLGSNFRHEDVFFVIQGALEFDNQEE
jgi:hypothetical protein